jgi:hypothetical protein
MTYVAKDFTKLLKMKDFSETLLQNLPSIRGM